MKKCFRALAVILAVLVVISTMPMLAFADEVVVEGEAVEGEVTYPVIQLDTPVEVVCDTEGENAYFTFTPAESTTYVFYSTGDIDTYGYICDSQLNELVYDDDGGNESNFYVEYALEAGVTYILRSRLYSSENTGSYIVAIGKLVDPQSVTVSCAVDKIYVGTTYNLSYQINPITARNDTIVWSSSDESIAKVDSYGVLTAVAEGTVTITAACENYPDAKGTLEITVIDYPVMLLDTTVSQTVYHEEYSNSFYYKFVPEETDFYLFAVNYNSNGGYGTGSNILNSEFQSLGYSDNLHHTIYKLEAGKTYYMYFAANAYEADVYITAKLTKTVGVEDIEFISLPTADYIKNYGTPEYFGLVMDFKLSDGTTKRWSYDLYWEGEQEDILGMSPRFYDDYNSETGYNSDVNVSIGGCTEKISLNVIDNPVKSIEYYSGSIEIPEFTNGYYNTYNENKYYYYQISNFVDNIEVKVTYNDSTEYISKINDYINGYSVSYYSSQETAPWTVGSENYFTASYLGFEVQIPVTITESPVKGIALLSGDITILENTSGYYTTDESGNEFYYYTDIYNQLNNLQFEITYNDGTSVTGRYGYSIDGNAISYSQNQYNEHWALGSDNYVTFEYMGKSVDVPVTIIANPIKSIEYASGEITLVENIGGYLTDDEDSYYYHLYNEHLSELSFLVTYADGSSETVSYGDALVDLEGYGWDYNTNQGYEHWETGKENFTEISYCGHEISVPVNIIENPVKSLELVSGSVEYEENSDGYIETDSDGNEYFRYYFGSDYLSDVTFKVTYTDDSVQYLSYGDENDKGIEHIYWNYDEDQYNNHWAAGKSNSVTVEYFGKEVEVPVVINISPVASIEVVSGEITIFENTKGYYTTYNGEEYYHYSDLYDFLNDLTFKVNFNDGTSLTGEYGNSIGGYYISYNTQSQHQNHWVLGSENYLTVNYRGKSVQVPVTIAESPIKSIEPVSDLSVELIENGNGYFEFDDYGVEYFYYAIPSNLMENFQFNVTYTDGSSKVIDWPSFAYDNYNWSWWDNQHWEHWQLGSGNYLTMEYMGFEFEVEAVIIENPIESITLVSDGIEFIENSGGYYETDANGEEYYRYDFENKLWDLEFEIKYKDGTTKTAEYDDTVIEGYVWSCNTDQYNTHWEKDTENYVYVTYLNIEIKVPVKIVDTLISSMTLVSDGIEILENSNGYYEIDDYGDKFYYYSDLYSLVSALQFEITFNDGTSGTYSYDEYIIDGYYWQYSSSQYSEHWTKENQNYLTVSYLGKSVDVPVTIVDNPVKSIELVSGKVELIENYNGYFDTDHYGNEMFYYYVYIERANLKFKVEFTDGTTQTVEYGDIVIEGYDWGCSDNQYGEPWKVDKDNSLTVEYLGFDIDVPVIVKENPVESIELASGEIEIIENCGGYYTTDYQGNEMYYYSIWDLDCEFKITFKDGSVEYGSIYDYIIYDTLYYSQNQNEKPWKLGSDNSFEVEYLGVTVQIPVTIIETPIEQIELVSGNIEITEYSMGYWYENGEYFEYWIDEDIWDNLEFAIHYKDGTSETAYIGDVINGYYFGYEYNQYENPWTLGSDNYITATLMGAEYDIPVTIVESPVESIVINKAPTKEYIYGDVGCGYMYDNTYEITDFDLNGIEFTVNYKNGESEKYSYKDLVFDDDYNVWTLNGCLISEPDYLEVTEIGEYTASINYLGALAEFALEVVSSSVASIEVVRLPDITELKYNRFELDMIGAQIKITYTDGTSEIVTIDETNISYSVDYDGMIYYDIDVNGYSMTAEYYWDEGNAYKVTYLGAICYISYQVGEESLEFVKVEGMNKDGKDITVVYKGESGELITLKLDPVATQHLYSDPENSNSAFVASTPYGLFVYFIDTYFNEDGKPLYYYTSLDYYSAEINHLRGDLSRNGVLDAADLTLMRKALLDPDSVGVEIGFCYDLNGNGEIDVIDLVVLKKLIANPAVLGDVDNNGVVTEADLAALRKVLLSDTSELTAQEIARYDINGNGVVDIVDYVALKNLINELYPDVYGDIDDNGAVDATDLTLMRKALLNPDELTADEVSRCDLNGNGEVDVIDLVKLKKLVAESAA